MARKTAPVIPQGEDVGAPLKLKEEAMGQLTKLYESEIADEMGKLHNRFVAYISEARLPLTHVIMVLEMLHQETLELAKKQYLGDE